MAIPRLTAAMIKTPFNRPGFIGVGPQCNTVWTSFSEKDCDAIFQKEKLTTKAEVQEICKIKPSYRTEACDKPYISFIMSPNENLSFSEIFLDRKIAFHTFQIIICRIFPFAITGNAVFILSLTVSFQH